MKSLWVNQLFNVRPDDNIHMTALDRVYGNIQPYEVFALLNIIVSIKAKKIFEFGTFDGRTTKNMAMNIPEDAFIVSLDLAEDIDKTNTKYSLASNEISLVLGNRSGWRFKGTAEEKKITCLYGDSATLSFSKYYNMFDLVFIDGSHTYKYVESDTENAYKIANKDRGVIVWHDYGDEFPDVKRFLDSSYELKSDYGFYHLKNTLLVVALPNILLNTMAVDNA